MLEVNRLCAGFAHQRMPVDFAAYLVSASPPGVGFYPGPNQLYCPGSEGVLSGGQGRPDGLGLLSLKGGFHDGHRSAGGKPESRESLSLPHVPPTMTPKLSANRHDDDDGGLTQTFLDCCQVRDRSEAEPGSEDGSTGSRTPHSRPESPKGTSTPTSPKGGAKKKVSFADDLGFALENIRIMSEPSDTPPQLRPEIFKSLTQGALAGASVTPPLMLTFPQPASDYIEFRRRLETDCVCLENVILKDYNVMGTIKVKNISFEKTVLVRCTFDEWDTIDEYQAAYVANSATPSQFDTFSFNIIVPTNMQTMHLCVNYKAANNNFWDSNKGGNYKIVTADWKQCNQPTDRYRDDAAIYGLGSDQDWSVYSSWSNRDMSLPYY